MGCNRIIYIITILVVLSVPLKGEEVFSIKEMEKLYVEWENNPDANYDSLVEFRIKLNTFCDIKENVELSSSEREAVYSLVHLMMKDRVRLYSEMFRLMVLAPDESYNPWLVNLVESRSVKNGPLPESIDIVDVLDLTIDDQSVFDLFVIALKYPNTRSGEDSLWALGNSDIWTFLYTVRVAHAVDVNRIILERKEDIKNLFSEHNVTDEDIFRFLHPWRMLNELIELNESNPDSALIDFVGKEQPIMDNNNFAFQGFPKRRNVDRRYFKPFYEDLIDTEVVYAFDDQMIRSQSTDILAMKEAVWQLGKGYVYGLSAQHENAMRWLNLGVNLGEADAVNILGEVYAQGIGVKTDKKKALSYFYSAAEDMCSSAIYNLGYCYEFGIGVNKDLSQAVEWYQKAANLDHARAQYCLAYCYERGAGVDRDINKAIRLYKKSLDNAITNESSIENDQLIKSISTSLSLLLYEIYED